MSCVPRVAVFLAILSAVPARTWAQDAASQVQQASAAYARQDYAEAARLFRLAADAGNVDGQHYLGHMYQRGLGVPEDQQQALKLLRLAADAGNADAQNDVGNIHFTGHSDLASASQRMIEAAKYFRMSAAQGFAPAQLMLGMMHYNGLGMPRDEKAARRFLGLAAAQGNADARGALARLDSMARAAAARNAAERSGPPFMYASGQRRYRMDITQTQTSAAPDDTVRIDRQSSEFISVAVTPDSMSPRVSVLIVIDSIVPRSVIENPSTQPASATLQMWEQRVRRWRGFRIAASMQPGGRLRSVVPARRARAMTDEEVRIERAEFAQGYGRVLPAFPGRGGPEVGMTWTDTTITMETHPLGYREFTSHVVTSRIAADTTVAGRPAWRVERTGTISDRTEGGTAPFFRRHGTSTERAIVTRDGEYLGGEYRHDIRDQRQFRDAEMRNFRDQTHRRITFIGRSRP